MASSNFLSTGASNLPAHFRLRARDQRSGQDDLPLATSAPSNTHQQQQETKHIRVITGPAGCGKTSSRASTPDIMPYLEGDTYHTPENVEKMRTPLTDADRWDWLTLLREEALHPA